MRKLEVKQLEYFAAVAEYLSFTKAAEAVHIAQPAISQQIKQLEKDLGVMLFHRDNKRVLLTEAGNMFLTQAKAVLEEVDNAIGVIEELKGLERGSVNIGMSSTMATVLMSDIAKEFQRKFPFIKVKITESSTLKSLNRLKDGELDIAILSLPLPVVDDELLETDSLYEEKLSVIVPAEHPLLQEERESVSFKELNAYPWILPNNTNTLRKLINEACENSGFCPLVRMEVDRISVVRSLLFYSGNGVSILPTTSVSYELNVGSLRRIDLKDTEIYRAVGIVTRNRKSLPPATLEMIEMIKDICQDYPKY